MSKDNFEHKFPNITNHQSVVIPLIYVEKYCIEKQRVREVVDKILNGVKDSAPESWKKQIKKELEL